MSFSPSWEFSTKKKKKHSFRHSFGEVKSHDKDLSNKLCTNQYFLIGLDLTFSQQVKLVCQCQYMDGIVYMA